MGATRPVAVEWQGRGLVFSGGGEGRPAITVDGDTKEAPSPVETLLIAIATCTASDVVSIIEKKRLKLESLRVDIAGVRREEYPRRFLSISMTWRVKAAGATEAAVRQAIDLSLEKYCSVSHSLNPDIPISYELVLQA